MLTELSAAVTQTDYYLTLLKYIGLCIGITVGTVSFFAIVVTMLAVARYSR